MRSWDQSAIGGLIAAGVPESASLEFKRELHLDTKSNKTEAAKDLTSIGNAGGGTVLFGVDEDSNDWPVATNVTPLTDPSLPSVLENILQAGVRPPLVATFTRVDLPGGYVLAAEVEPSPLGPYMVELYGERRFHIRDGNITRRMTEAEVSQAYALAARAQDRREDSWATHELPIAPPDAAVWLTIAGLPQEPLAEIIDLAAIEPADLRPPTEPTVYLNQWSLADMSNLFRSMTRWSEGFHAEATTGPSGQLGRRVRIHRDGAAGISLQVEPAGEERGPVALNRTSRILNGALIYLGWLWNHFGVRRPVELRIRMQRCDRVPFQIDHHEAVDIIQPSGMQVDSVELHHVLGIDELRRSSRRHLLCLRFADRIAQAFGFRQAQYPYRWGELYGAHGHPLDMSVGESEIYVGGSHAATIYAGGPVVCSYNGQPVGSFADGVLADDEGHLLGVLELAPGTACPDDFLATELRTDPAGAAPRLLNAPREAFASSIEMPTAIPMWSSKHAATHIRGF